MNINVVFDNNPVPAPAIFQQDVIDVARMIESQFTDPITFTLHVGYGEVGGFQMDSGALGESLPPNESAYTYAALRSHVQADATTADDTTAAANLPGTDPISGWHAYNIGEPEAAALGLPLPAGTTSIDAYIGLANGNLFDFNRSDGITTGKYDFIGTVLHEVTEVMGRVLDTGSGILASYALLDLFHYASAGHLQQSGTHAGYFSIDGGTTPLFDFNTNRGGDAGDWADPQDSPGSSHYAGNDSFNAFSNSGVENAISEVDLVEMDVGGYDRHADDVRGNATTSQTIAVDGTNTGNIEACLDQDWFACTLSAGWSYVITEQGADLGHGAPVLTDAFLRLYDSTGTLIRFKDNASRPDSQIVFVPTASGTYYVSAGAHKDGYDDTSNDGVNNGTFYLGTYTVKLNQDDFGDESSTASPVTVSAVSPPTISGAINYSGDRDWFQVHLIAGFTYDFAERGAVLADTSNGTLSDPYLRFYDTDGTSLLLENDNKPGGPTGDNDAAIHYIATITGNYFLAAAQSGDNVTGTYTLTTSVDDHAPDLVTLSGVDVAENQPAGTVVGTIGGHDPDANDSLTFSLVSNPGGAFAVSGNQLVTTKPLDYETTPSYPVTIRATDVYGKFLDQNFAIAVDDVSPEIINGTPGNDRLAGGRDRDFITGFRGKDLMTGHGAADRFVFKAIVDSRPGRQHDVITDFDQGSGRYVHTEGDRIDLTGIEALYHAHFWFAAQPITHAGPRNHVGFDSAHGLLQLDLNGDGTVDFAVALANLHHLVRGDLLL